MNIRNKSSNFAAQNKGVEARQPKKQTIKNNKQSLFSAALLRGCSFLYTSKRHRHGHETTLDRSNPDGQPAVKAYVTPESCCVEILIVLLPGRSRKMIP